MYDTQQTGLCTLKGYLFIVFIPRLIHESLICIYINGKNYKCNGCSWTERHKHTNNSENSVNMDELSLSVNLCANIRYMEDFYSGVHK